VGCRDTRESGHPHRGTRPAPAIRSTTQREFIGWQAIRPCGGAYRLGVVRFVERCDDFGGTPFAVAAS
jgi:hypothetical protein